MEPEGDWEIDVERNWLRTRAEKAEAKYKRLVDNLKTLPPFKPYLGGPPERYVYFSQILKAVDESDGCDAD